jgi:aminoglycoside phosphotransferase (APT) family kinase protein
MTGPRFAAEADAKVLRALEHIEEAQRELGCACQELCPIIGGVSQWKRVRALYDRVHAEWYRVHAWAEKRRGHLDLDGSGRSALARTQEVQAGDLIEGTKLPASDGGA